MNGFPKPVSKIGLMLLNEINVRHAKELQDTLRVVAEQDGVPLDGSVHLNYQTRQWELPEPNPETTLTLHRHDGAPSDG